METIQARLLDSYVASPNPQRVALSFSVNTIGWCRYFDSLGRVDDEAILFNAFNSVFGAWQVTMALLCFAWGVLMSVDVRRSDLLSFSGVL